MKRRHSTMSYHEAHAFREGMDKVNPVTAYNRERAWRDAECGRRVLIRKIEGIGLVAIIGSPVYYTLAV